MINFDKLDFRLDLVRMFIYESRFTRSLCRLLDENGNPENTFMRTKKISHTTCIEYQLNRQSITIDMEIRNLELIKKGKDKVEYTDQALVNRLAALNPQAFVELNRIYLNGFYNYENDSSEIIKTKGYILLGGDGSKFNIPPSKANIEHYGGAKNKSKKEVVKPQATVAALYDLNNKFYIDTLVDKCDISEIMLARKSVLNAKKVLKQEKFISIFDRGYASLGFYNYLIENGFYFTIRAQEGYYAEEISKMTSDDEWVDLRNTYDRVKDASKHHADMVEIMKKNKVTRVRITKIKLSTGEIEHLISNLPMDEFSTEDMGEIYNARWGVETSFDTVKNKLKMDAYSGNKPINVEQDIYATVVVHNMIMDEVKYAQLALDEEEKEKDKTRRKPLKHKKKVNINKAIGIFKEQIIKIFIIDDPDMRMQKLTNLLDDIKRYTYADVKDKKSPKRSGEKSTSTPKTNRKRSY